MQPKHALAVAACWLIFACAAPALAGKFEDAASAYKKGDYTTALQLFRSMADQGDVRAELGLADMYELGQGTPKDEAEAVKWYRAAADKGNAIGQLGLGFMYAEGNGVPQDFPEAAKWYRLAADQGEPMAQFQIGHIYETGEGLPKDVALAYMWFSLSATQGFQNAKKMRDQLALRMTPDQIKAAEKLVGEHKATSQPTK
jgi:hypothetical protein